jgi:4-hydroxybutyrate CoA-transferase
MGITAVSPQDAVSRINPASTIFIAESCGEPQTLIEALVADRERLRGCRLIECRRFPGAPYASLTDYFRILTLHPTSDYRDAVKTGKADFMTLRLSQAHTVLKSLRIDVALIQTAPPDSEGNCSLSASTGMTLDAALSANMIIAEINTRMPRAYGVNSIPARRFACAIETSREMLQYPVRPVDHEEMAVARQVAALIDDGCVLSTGIGGISEAVMGLLGDRRDLGVHIGMMTDGVMEAMQRGIVTNRTKGMRTGKTVAGVAVGSQKLFQFINQNPEVELHPFSFTHDIRNLARIEKFVAVNSAVEVDLTGQVNAESLGPVQISTVGGQADFALGACQSKGGKSVIALSSATRGGKASKIVASFGPGTIISTPRYDVQYVVTEYGVAELGGKTMAQRAEALISVAHPKFREELQQKVRESSL